MKDTKEHIMNVALGLFLRKNFKEVTMEEIVRKTRMSKGAFYHYFDSKEDLFREILNLYFFNMMAIDYPKFSKESLYQFGRDYIAELEKRIERPKSVSLNNINYLFLIFDGIKHFPEFRKKVHESQLVELNAWKNIVGIARKSGEIKSSMTDEQIAKIFVFITDGVGIRLIMENKIGRMKEEIFSIWDGLYGQLKA